MTSFKIKFWGVRGSIPTPGRSTLQYGGNTPCVEIKFKNGPLFILDAGTGIRQLGKKLQCVKKPVHAYIFLSHFHWDHIQGLPFFRPAFNRKNHFTILGSDDAAIKLDRIISFQMDPTYFPITIDDMPANIRFRSIKEEQFEIEGVNIETIYLNHPGYALGFRMSYRKKSLIYISDNEPFNFQNKKNDRLQKKDTNRVEKIFESFVEDKDQRLIDFCREADILIHDTQFFPHEYREKLTWGHSPYSYTVDLAIKSNVKNLVLFHHDPDHNDKMIDKIQKYSRQLIKKENQSLSCVAAKEGMIISA